MTDGQRSTASSTAGLSADGAVQRCPSVTNVVVVKRTKQDVEWVEGRDLWWHDAVEAQPETHSAQSFDSEQPLFLLYTSGTTGKPKGILHTSGGYLTQVAYTHKVVFDLKPEEDVYCCLLYTSPSPRD